MTHKMNCTVCKHSKTQNKDIFNCDGCNSAICKECGKLTAAETKVLQLTSGRAMKFYCPSCLNGKSIELFQKLLDSKDIIIEDKTTIINLLKEEIEKMKQDLKVDHGSYSNAVQKQKKEVIIIKPKDSSQSSETTKKTIKEKINPCSLGEGVGVSTMKYIKDGGVAIKCIESGNQNIENICTNIKDSLGQSYEVEIPEKRNPRIIVFNVRNKELENEGDLVNKLIVQNTINTNPDTREIKLVYKYQNKKGLNNVIFQFDKQSYECISRKEKICIGWQTCSYKDSVNVKQCYNCWKFGHMATDCQKTGPTCQICAGEHKGKECQANIECCVNCKHALEVLKIPNIDCTHRAYDRKCEAYKRIVEKLQEKVDYPEMHIGRDSF